MTFGFDPALLAQELDAVTKSNNSSGNAGAKKVRNTFLKHPGIKMAVKDSGIGYRKQNKQGTFIEKTARQVRGVVLDSAFSFAQWGKPDGKPKMLCSSISHTNKDETPGNGSWQLPGKYDSNLMSALNPQGFKGMSCLDCKAAGENTECKQSGAIHILVTGLDHGETDSDDNFIGLKPVDPFIAHITIGGFGSRNAYMDFIQQDVPKGTSPATIEAIFGTEENPKMPAKKQLTITAERPYSETEKAMKMLQAEQQKLADEEAKRLAEWKAKNPLSGKAASKSNVNQDDDLPF